MILLIFFYKITDIFSNRISNDFYEISCIEATKLSKNIITESINETVLKNIDINSFFSIERDNNGKIQSVDFNTKKTNEIQLLINSNVKKYLKELENGESSIIDVKKNLITNDYISNKKGIFFDIPLGVVFNNVLLSNVGPKIPVKLSVNGDVISTINTSAEAYGINNTLLKISINIKVNEQIILPKLSKNIIVENNIPLALKMIQGEIPNYYINSFEKSNNYDWNMHIKWYNWIRGS